MIEFYEDFPPQGLSEAWRGKMFQTLFFVKFLSRTHGPIISQKYDGPPSIEKIFKWGQWGAPLGMPPPLGEKGGYARYVIRADRLSRIFFERDPVKK